MRKTKPTIVPIAARQVATRYRVEAVSRAARILRQFTRTASAHTNSELAAKTGLSPALVVRTLSTLRMHGLIQVAPDGEERVALGLTWLRLADVRRRQFHIRMVALPVMRWMRDAVDETVILSIRAGDRRVNIDYVECNQAIRRLTQPGFEVPLHVGASGRALLSGLAPEQVQRYLKGVGIGKAAVGSRVSMSRIFRDVESVRKIGYAIAYREITTDTAAVAAPIRDHLGQVVAALTISCPEERFTDQLKKRCIRSVLAGSVEVSRALGHQTGGPG